MPSGALVDIRAHYARQPRVIHALKQLKLQAERKGDTDKANLHKRQHIAYLYNGSLRKIHLMAIAYRRDHA
jgi:hypothetical protein